VILLHFVACVFRQRVSTLEDRVANAFRLATGQEDCLLGKDPRALLLVAVHGFVGRSSLGLA
jgi:hypothetical protein